MISTTKKLLTPYHTERLGDLFSPILNRTVVADVFIPANYSARKKYPFLLLNDGQDNDAVRLHTTLSRFARKNQMRDIIAVTVHAGNRMHEYGVAGHPDYRGRGSRADLYTHFLMEELLPLIGSSFRLDLRSGCNTIAGYSLGGLSAFDIGWQHPEIFQRIGVFSGSLWWRDKSYAEGFDEKKDRIIHNIVRNSRIRKGMKFFFQTGTLDEKADRNKNGIIDSIDDTLDLIVELTKLGYRPYDDIQYLEIKNGKHHPHTWAKAMPEFLKWAFE